MKGCLKTILRGFLLLLCAFIALIFISTPSGDNPSPDTGEEPDTIIVTTTKGQFVVPGNAFMDGRDPEANPPLTITRINIWNAAPRQEVVCELSHGDGVQIQETKRVAEEDRYYFKVSSGSCEGWVSESFLSIEAQEPVGDLVQ